MWRCALPVIAVLTLVVGCRGGIRDALPAHQRGGVVVTTTVSAAPPPELGPAPEEIPTDARDVVHFLPPPEAMDHVHLSFLEEQDNFIAGSAKVEAVYPGRSGPEYLLRFAVQNPRAGRLTCLAVATPGEEPDGWGCGTPGAPGESGIGGLGYTTEAGPNEIEVEHSPDVTATVIELRDGSTFIVHPGDATVSFHRWTGAPPARVTVFFEDGTKESVLTSS